MRENGFSAEVHDVSNIAEIKQRYGVPTSLAGCHTALIDGYVIEGHVPAEDIERLLSERPQIIGIAVPGMPVGSPGMEVPGRPPVRYDVIAFDETGATSVYASR